MLSCQAQSRRAGLNPNFARKSILEASSSLGLKLGALQLPLPSAAHLASRGELEGAPALPAAFDAGWR